MDVRLELGRAHNGNMVRAGAPDRFRLYYGFLLRLCLLGNVSSYV